MTARIHIDDQRCIASGNCTAIAPDWFSFDDDDRVVARQPAPGEQLPPDVDAAANQCPVAAIAIEHAAT